MLLIVPKHPPEPCIQQVGARDRPPAVTVRHSGGPLGSRGTNQSFGNSQCLFDSWPVGEEFVIFASLGSNVKLCFYSDTLATPCGMCICLSESVSVRVPACLCTLESMHAWLLFVCTAVSVSGGGWWPSTK